jgi:NAD(P)-dependent dehydrogenase (short-subunit alcohol dehydrogenase family)
VDGAGAAVGETAVMADSIPLRLAEMRGLDGKRALVTGAARGIGRATAERLAAEGSRVALVDVDANLLAEAAAAVGPTAVALDADVRDEDAIRAAIQRAVDALGGLDVVVPNAAIQLVGSDDRADSLDRAIWDETIDVNLTGAFLTAKYGAQALLATSGGAVVFIASPAGTHGIARGLQAYSASKAGMVGLVRAMAADYASDAIRVNAVLPGITDTPMQDKVLEEIAVLRGTTPEELHQSRLNAVPLQQRGCQPRDMAEVIAFLLSSAASYMTGQALAVDGGLIMF